jgi:hypothetical protein
LGENIGQLCDAAPERVRAHHKILESSPDLMAKQLFGEFMAMRDITATIHEHYGLPDSDLRPMIVTKASYGAHSAALYLWNRAGGRGSVVELVREAFALAEPVHTLESLSKLRPAVVNG